MAVTRSSVARGLGGTIGLLALALAPQARGQCQYDIEWFQGPGCGIFGQPPTIGLGINDEGTVVGYYFCALGPDQAFIWQPETGLVTLDVNPANMAEANGADLDMVVGFLEVPGDGMSNLAFMYDGVQVTNLGTLPGGNMSEAEAVCNGTVVGWSRSANSNREAFVWKEGVMTNLGAELGTPYSDALDVNAAGQVTGWMGTWWLQDGNAYLWQEGSLTVLPPVPGGFISMGLAVNDAGDVGGHGLIVDPQNGQKRSRAFVWFGGEMIRIDPFPGFLMSAVVDLNSNRQAVGMCWGTPDWPSASRAFIWQNGVMTDLNDLIPPGTGLTIRDAYGINEQGQIAGDANAPVVGRVALRMTPHPGPPGDLDGDCHVSTADFLKLLVNWGPCPQSGPCAADLDGSGTVNFVDLLMLLSDWS